MWTRSTSLVLPALAAAALVAGCGSSGYQAAAPATDEHGSSIPSTSAVAGPAEVSTASGEIGTHLVALDGRSLYLFEKDTSSASTCVGACARAWPPLLTIGAPKASGAAAGGLLGTSSRDQGKIQVTYAGHPLYEFSGDAGPGDTAGQESKAFGASWYLLAPSGSTIEGDKS